MIIDTTQTQLEKYLKKIANTIIPIDWDAVTMCPKGQIGKKIMHHYIYSSKKS